MPIEHPDFILIEDNSIGQPSPSLDLSEVLQHLNIEGNVEKRMEMTTDKVRDWVNNKIKDMEKLHGEVYGKVDGIEKRMAEFETDKLAP
ncbi:hypothetical protein RRF57_001129 [Xylaria bambusicola]|uniref:Uncharacterized protein n=1 Tax=Xylaria bambusicola TaxID=326684 RepID=A0AAN7UBY9_9PEZI